MSYSLQKALKFCLVTDINNTSMIEYKHLIQESVRGGITMVQLREKTAAISDMKYKALELQSILKPLGIPLIINDSVELAVEINADGVHLGQQDMDIASARKILGPNKIIGLSIESMEELYSANRQQGISYVAASAIFPTKTKPECKKIWGLPGLQSLVSESKYPVIAIGGINADNAGDVFNMGAHGIAVIGAIHNAPDPYIATQELISCMKSNQNLFNGEENA